jgi:hypothetical protein
MESKGKVRKPYCKPQVHQVKLHIEEAVLQGCKTAPGATPGMLDQYCGHGTCKKTYTSS